MGTVVKYDNIFQYNESRGVETLHPLVSVIDFSKAEPIPPGHYRHCFGFYAVFLKDVKCGDLRYGRNYYDYQEGTLVFMAPGQVVEVEVKDKPQVPPKGRALLFHPDLLRGTSLGRNIAGYTFFSYEVNEALHLSEQERQVVMDCLQNIQSELKHAIDKHSRTLIVSNIELLLNYSTRFYERQFITRNNVNRDVLAGFERLLGDYFAGDRPERDGVPSVRWCAEQLHLSANYFGDLVKKETGKSAQEYIQLKVIDIAKERIFDPDARSAKSPTRWDSATRSTSRVCSRRWWGVRPTNTGPQTDTKNPSAPRKGFSHTNINNTNNAMAENPRFIVFGTKVAQNSGTRNRH